MKPVKTLVQLREQYATVKTTCAGDTRFIAQAMMFAAEEHAHLVSQLRSLHRDLAAQRRTEEALALQIQALGLQVKRLLDGKTEVGVTA